MKTLLITADPAASVIEYDYERLRPIFTVAP